MYNDSDTLVEIDIKNKYDNPLYKLGDNEKIRVIKLY
jgi:hypothetical protein